ncbi:hypothetical protein DFP72DRAFT_476154 [Ephemerocybe angulata]|uniref:Uncharacterized protein n=1 Tax=Ephemerocybe angulata TaxID=980116 RepID=A0A8H6HRR4_9AGAR|nr:hypothetical protein DFP72DRAFT_476154 [Tulosesus angulatus]
MPGMEPIGATRKAKAPYTSRPIARAPMANRTRQSARSWLKCTSRNPSLEMHCFAESRRMDTTAKLDKCRIQVSCHRDTRADDFTPHMLSQTSSRPLHLQHSVFARQINTRRLTVSDAALDAKLRVVTMADETPRPVGASVHRHNPTLAAHAARTESSNLGAVQKARLPAPHTPHIDANHPRSLRTSQLRHARYTSTTYECRRRLNAKLACGEVSRPVGAPVSQTPHVYSPGVVKPPVRTESSKLGAKVRAKRLDTPAFYTSPDRRDPYKCMGQNRHAEWTETDLRVTTKRRVQLGIRRGALEMIRWDSELMLESSKVRLIYKM